MWTVIVEVHLSNGKGTVFRIGEWPRKRGANNFARELEQLFGEDKVSTGVAYLGNLMWRLADKISQGKVSVKQGIFLPSCDDLDFD